MPGLARKWFSYNGTGDITLPSSYIYSPSSPTCINGFHLCSIYSQFALLGITPVIVTVAPALQNYIAGVLSTGLAQPVSSGAGFASKLFVYGKV